jgi:hypothetical protein
LFFTTIVQQTVKEAQLDAEEARSARDEALATAREQEKRMRAAETEVHSLQEQLDAALIGRRKAEAERDALNDELHGTAKG